jgi:hypothetical protein
LASQASETLWALQAVSEEAIHNKKTPSISIRLITAGVRLNSIQVLIITHVESRIAATSSQPSHTGVRRLNNLCQRWWKSTKTSLLNHPGFFAAKGSHRNVKTQFPIRDGDAQSPTREGNARMCGVERMSFSWTVQLVFFPQRSNFIT